MTSGRLWGGLTAILLVGGVVCLAASLSSPLPVTEEEPTFVQVPLDSGASRDAPTLALWSEAAGVPILLTEAVAWTESGRNLDPLLRGAAGEVGRFQIKPSTARLRCPRQNITTARGNLTCFLRIVRRDYATCGGDWRCTIARYNGAGPMAAAYADRVLGYVRRRVLAEVTE